MTLWKRGRQYWMDTVVGGQRYRAPLHTTDWREAKEREKERLTELVRRPADPARRGRTYGALDVSHAIETYAKERRAQGVTAHGRLLDGEREAAWRVLWHNDAAQSHTGTRLAGDDADVQSHSPQGTR